MHRRVRRLLAGSAAAELAAARAAALAPDR
jgi:hypothetical protein